MDAARPKILIFIEHYLPGYKFGGPIRSVANLVSLLKSHYDIFLVTRDRDQGDRQPYTDVVIGQWIRKDGYSLLYLPPHQFGIGTVRRLLAERTYDYLYTNSLFSRFTRVLLLLSVFTRRRLTIAPRGELHEGALRLKAYKKRPYVSLMRLLTDRLVIWHATDQQEVEAIQRTFDGPQVACVPIRFAPDMPGSLAIRNAWHKSPGQLRLLSLARLARNKGLKFLLECLTNVPEGDVVLDIYGPIVDARYWEECQQLIRAMPAHCKVTYQGELNHALVGQTMRQYDFLAMPTHGENFGHVIFEALSSGLPVLISDQTPWRDLEKLQAGFDIPLDRQAWLEKLTHCLNLDSSRYSDSSKASVKLSNTYLHSQSFEQDYIKIFS